jgi:outer membrane protein
MPCSQVHDRIGRALLAASTVSSLWGCASSSLDLAPPRADRAWAPETTAGGEIRPGVAAKEAPAGTDRTFVLPPNVHVAELALSADVDPARAYTLADLIDIAQTQNPLTQVAWNAARDAALGVGIAWSTYLPHLTAAVVGGYNGLVSTNSVSANTEIRGIDTVNGGGSSTASGGGGIATLGLQWLLFDFGQRAAEVSTAKQLAVASNVRFTAAHQQIAYAVAIAFYKHAAAAQRVSMVEKALANAKDVQAAAELRLQQGENTAVDVAQARQATAQAEVRSVQAKGTAQDSYYELMAAIGISPMTRLLIADVSGRPMPPSVMEMTESTIKEAVSRRPDVLAAYANAKAAEAAMGVSRAAFYPKVFASGNVAYTAGSLSITSIPEVGQEAATANLTSSGFSGTVIGGLVIPIYDGGVRGALHKRSQDRLDSANAVLRQTCEQSVREIVVADNALRTSLSALEADHAWAHAAETAFDAALTSYRSGVGSVTVTSLAESTLLDAHIAEVDAYSAAQIAAATLAFATGRTGEAPPGGAL